MIFLISRSILDPPTTLISILVVLGLIGYGVWMAKKRPVLSFCILWYFGNLVIESSIFPLEMVFEHRLYLPPSALSFSSVWGSSEGSRNGRRDGATKRGVGMGKRVNGWDRRIASF